MFRIAFGDMALGLIFFIVIAFAFIHVFGAPECESVANQTALQLKFAIDHAAKSQIEGGLPYYLEDDVPENEYYYTLAPIRLCQEQGEYSFALSFVGGMPEYQIYYERFPETGWTWNEAYPWSGGAASTLVFWAGMRGVTTAFKLTKGALAYRMLKQTRVLDKIKKSLTQQAVTLKNVLLNTQSFHDEIGDAIINKYIAKGRNLDEIFEQLNKKDAHKLLKFLADNDYLKKQGDNIFLLGDRLVTSKKNIGFAISTFDSKTGTMTTKRIAFKCPGCPSKFDEALFLKNVEWDKFEELVPGDPVPSGYVVPQINVRKAFSEYVDRVAKEDPIRAESIKSIIVTNVDVEGNQVINLATATDDVLKPKITKKIYDATMGKLKRTVTYFKEKFYGDALLGDEVFSDMESFYKYSTNKLPALPDGAYAEAADTVLDELGNPIIISSFNSGNPFTKRQFFNEYVMKEVIELKDLGFKDKIKFLAQKYLKIGEGVEITPDLATDALNRWLKEEGGGIAPQSIDSLRRVVTKMQDKLLNDGGAGPAVGDWFDWCMNNYDDFNNYFGGYGRDIINELGNNIQSGYSPVKQLFDKHLSKTYSTHFINYLARAHADGSTLTPAQQEIITRELGHLIGIIKKDRSVIKLSIPQKLALGGVAEVKKLAYIEGTALVAPNSWYWRGLMASEMTEGCQGNSICLYSHATQVEGPIYLENYTSDFFVRVWRPVEPWKQIAGIQAAMAHIPSHPRFYVVSPCFAIAKVWKTIYNGEKTIFVYPINVDMKGEASNYCYADAGIINEYTTIWAVSDIADIFSMFIGLGHLKGAMKVVEQVVDVADPVTFGQCMFEAAISWPRNPWKTLNLETMKSEAAQAEYGNLRERLEQVK